jgi:hypothetical protein
VKLPARARRTSTAAILCIVVLVFWPANATGEGLSAGSARIHVKPRNAEVYVDGYLAGTVDQFDGFFQRLEVPAGEHELTLYLDGYRTVRQKVFFPPETALDIKYALQPLTSGEPHEARPQAPADGDHPAGPPPPPASVESHGPSNFGALAIRVQPAGATVVIDGQEWTALQSDGPMVIELREGSHEIEVKSEGFSTFRKNVRVRAGETVSLNVSLTR